VVSVRSWRIKWNENSLDRGSWNRLQMTKIQEELSSDFMAIRCSQEFVNVMVANEAKFELRKAGWRRVVCHKSMFKWYEAGL